MRKAIDPNALRTAIPRTAAHVYLYFKSTIFALLITDRATKGRNAESHTQVDARNAKIDTSSRLINIIRTKETQILRLKIRSSH